MSYFKDVEINCPKCGKTIKYRAYSSVNVTLDPTLRDKIFDESLFVAKCPHCGHTEFNLRPLLYNDMNKNFMIQLDAPGNLYALAEEISDPSSKMNEFLCLTSHIKYYGVTGVDDLKTAITALENGLDWRIARMALFIAERQFTAYCEENNIEINGIEDSYAKMDDQNSCILSVVIVNIDGKSEKFVSESFKEMYDYCYKNYKERLELIDPFVFEGKDVMNTFFFKKKEYEKGEANKQTYYYVKPEYGVGLVCTIKPFLEKDVEVGSCVLLKLSDGDRASGVVTHIVKRNPYLMPNDEKYNAVIVGEYTKIHDCTTRDIDYVANQGDLQELYDACIKSSFKDGEALKALGEVNLIVCAVEKAPFSSSSENEWIELLKKNEKTGTCDRLSVFRVYPDEKHNMLLDTFSDPMYLPSTNDYVDTGVYSFNTLVQLVKNETPFGGIMINHEDNCLTLGVNDFIYKYIINSYLTDSDKMNDLLGNLTEEEKGDVLNDTVLQCFKLVHMENKTEQEAADECHITIEEAKKLSQDALDRLSDIIYARF